MNQLADRLEKAGVSQRYHKWLLVALVLIVARFILMPLGDWQQARIEAIEFNKLQTRGSDTIETMATSLTRQITELESELNEVKSFYAKASEPRQAEIAFAQNIEKFAVDNGLEVVSKSWETLFTTEYFARQKMDVQLEGNLKQLQKFITALESSRSPMYLIIETNMSSGRRTSSLDITLEIHQLLLVTESGNSGANA